MRSDETFVDEARLVVAAGDGGSGCASFRRERFQPRGGPDGADGGCGGDVVIVADRNLATLIEQRLRHEVRAQPGEPGRSAHRTGRNGEDALVRVPVGTLVFDAEAEPDAPPLADLVRAGDRFVASRGGQGGRGNARFATASRQAPDFAEPGEPGEKRSLRLSLKLLADVGLVGLPNAGKSTLLRRISAAKPRVAAYPFTTLVPALGVVERAERRFVVADLPGLIEGASDGAGLGDRFLRHAERTRVLVHVLDVGNALLEGRDPACDYAAVRRELEAYEPELLARAEIVALSKVDLVAERGDLAPLESELARHARSVHRVSAATGEGVEALVHAMARALAETDARAEASG
jgi:GTP-binding protein